MCDCQCVKSSLSSRPITDSFLGRNGYIFSNLSCGQVKLMAIVIGLNGNACCTNNTGSVAFICNLSCCLVNFLFIWHTGDCPRNSHAWHLMVAPYAACCYFWMHSLCADCSLFWNHISVCVDFKKEIYSIIQYSVTPTEIHTPLVVDYRFIVSVPQGECDFKIDWHVEQLHLK